MNWDDFGPRGRLFYRNREHQAAQLTAVHDIIGDISKYTVLDVGCGYGDFAHLISCKSYTGIDFDADAIDEARRLNPQATFHATTEITKADVIVAIGAIQCQVVEPREMLWDISRNAKRIGVVTCTTLHCPWRIEDMVDWWQTVGENPELVESADDFYSLVIRR